MLAAHSPSMSPSSPAETPDTSLEIQDDAPKGRRVSSRVRSKPTVYSDQFEPPSSVNGIKRKRALTVNENYAQTGLDGETSLTEESDPDGDPDEEELKEQRRKAKNTPKKPAAKRSKTKTTTLAMRPATNGVKKVARPRKNTARAPRIASGEETGLFGSC